LGHKAPNEGIAEMKVGLERARSTGAALFHTYYLAYLAAAGGHASVAAGQVHRPPAPTAIPAARRHATGNSI
jgi:hypothetical protein